MGFKPVGILGGMGPEATILLQQRLLATVEARDDGDHIPLLIDMNPQVPSRIAHLIDGTGEDPAPVLSRMAQRLDRAGATALAMPCNTAHHYAPAIRAATPLPFLDMVALSVALAAQELNPGARVGLLASPAVEQAGVFTPHLSAHGLTALWPADGDAMLAAIRSVKSHGPTPGAIHSLQNAARDLTAQGAELLFVACSEFSLLSHALSVGLPVIDTVDVLADAIRDHALT
ncbi:MAG: aspartate racemase [Rhodobacterales bacterium]|nr:MAG: aspartate racemase [Rhodobacterales bacterium]